MSRLQEEGLKTRALAGVWFASKALVLIDGDSPEIDVGRHAVPVVERVGIVRFVTQLVAAGRQSEPHIDFLVLTRTACVCNVGVFHLPHT